MMSDPSAARPRARDIGLRIGVMPTGEANAITDVPGVRVGHVSMIAGDGPLVPGRGPIRTGVTAILPHGGNLYANKVCAAAHMINGYGKTLGLDQVRETGAIETPIMLCSTINVWRVADAVIDHAAAQNPGVYSINPVVGECSDSALNDALGRHVGREQVFAALAAAHAPNTEEGTVGAGVGMTAFGWKGGIGTSSRVAEGAFGRCVVGALVNANTASASELRIDGVPVGETLRPGMIPPPPPDGSIIIVVATDAPLSSRQLGRLARRGVFGLARMGAIAHHRSGDVVIAFTTGNRIGADGRQSTGAEHFIPEPDLSTFFRAVAEATEEAITNALLRATTVIGRDGAVREAIPIEPLLAILARAGRIRS